MSSTWDRVRLSEVTSKIGSGATPRGGKEVYVPEGTAFIRSQNVYDSSFSFNGLARITEAAATQLKSVDVLRGDVLICITGESVTRTCIVADSALPARVSQHVAIIRPDPQRLDSHYLQAALLAPAMKRLLNQLSEAGATRRALTKAHIESLEIDLPPLVEQQRIAGVLRSLDDLIEINRSVASDCEALAHGLVESAPGRVTLSKVARILPCETRAPRGETDHYSLPAFDVDRLPDRVDGASIQSNKNILDRRSVLVSRLNPHIPRVWMTYPDPSVTSAASTEFVPLVGTDGESDETVWALCSHRGFLSQMHAQVTGTTGSHQRVDKDALLQFQVPDTRMLAESARSMIRELVREAFAARQSARSLSRVRNELLPLLLSGAVTVSEVAA